MIDESTIFLHVLLTSGIVVLTVLTLLKRLEVRQVLGEPRCQIRFHGRPNRN